MNNALAVSLAAALTFLSAPGWASFFASVPGGGPYDEASALVPAAFPTYPLKGGEWTVKVVPTYVTVSKSEGISTNGSGNTLDPKIDVKGGGGAVSLTYGFSPHFGVGLMGVGFSATGTGLLQNDTDTQAGDAKSQGYAGAVSVIYDPFSDPDGFRLPLMAGVGYVSLKENSTISGVTSGPFPGVSSETRDETIDGLAYMVGVSAQFNTGPIRWVPFAVVISPLSDEKVSETGVGNFSTGQTVTFKKSVGRGGLQVTYRPLNLGFLYSPPAKGVSIYSVTWQKSFGGS